jgi:aspartyl aminopeptidase
VGPASPFIPRIIERIGVTDAALSRSVLVGIENFDGVCREWASEIKSGEDVLELGGGVILRRAENRKIVTDVLWQGMVLSIAGNIDMRVREYVDTAPTPTTMFIGKAMSFALGLSVVSLGIPILGRGGIREIGSVNDFCALNRLIGEIIEMFWECEVIEDVD